MEPPNDGFLKLKEKNSRKNILVFYLWSQCCSCFLHDLKVWFSMGEVNGQMKEKNYRAGENILNGLIVKIQDLKLKYFSFIMKKVKRNKVISF